VHRFFNQDHKFLEPIGSFFAHYFSFIQFLFLPLELRMGFSHLLNTKVALANFRAGYDIPSDVELTYCHDGDIVLQRCPQVVFFSINDRLRRRVRFPVDPLILRTLRFYGLCPNQLPPKFYRVVSCVSQLNHLYGL